MTDYRVWAFAVSPARTVKAPTADPRGGRVHHSSDLRAALQSAADRAKEGAWTSVVFRTEEMDDELGHRRSNAARDALMAVALAGEVAADEAAASLAYRLAIAMDMRSTTNLLVIVGYSEGATGSSRVWTFPRDDAFRFDERDEPTIELLADVFSRTSALRKGARFDGEAHDASFVDGFALDYQTGNNSFDIANYWIGRFLDCRLGVTPTAGTQLVARAMKKLDATLTEPADRQTLTMAAVALQQSPRANWSLEDVADQLLPESMRESLLLSSERPEMNSSPFRLDKDLFNSMVATRVFSLESGVVVASPISEVGGEDEEGKPVVVSGNHLRAEGTIAKEALSGRRRGQAA